jgi:hypothetical protein
VGALAFSWLVPFPCFSQPLFRFLQQPLSPLDGFVFGMSLEPVVHSFPRNLNLLLCLGGIDVKHEYAPFACQFHVGKNTEFAASEGRVSPSAPALAAGPLGIVIKDVPLPHFRHSYVYAHTSSDNTSGTLLTSCGCARYSTGCLQVSANDGSCVSPTIVEPACSSHRIGIQAEQVEDLHALRP